VDILEGAVLFDHLPVDRVLVLRSTGDDRFDPGIGEHPADFGDHLLDERFSLRCPLGEFDFDLGVGAWVENRKTTIFELVLDLLDTQPMSKWGIDIECLPGNPYLFGLSQRIDGAHVVKPVEELDQQHPDILSHRHDHLADRCCLCLFAIRVSNPVQLGHAVDQLRDILSELPRQLGKGHMSVFDRVMEKGGNDGVLVEPILGEHQGYGEGMSDVGVAGLPLLADMGLSGHLVGTAQPIDITV